MMRIELDSVRKAENQSEWRYVGRARCLGLESRGDGHNIKLLCRKLIEAGHSGKVEVWRGETPVFGPIGIEKWADGKALTGDQPEQFKRGGTS